MAAGPPGPGSVLLRGGRIHSAADPRATAMLVVDGVVAWLGAEGAADLHADSAAEVIDLAGALVTPAFVDAHVHHTETGLTLLGLDLRGLPSLAAVLAAVAEASAGGTVLGHGWDQTGWSTSRPPTMGELDRASGGGLVYLSRVDVHSAVISAALAARVPGLAASRGFGPDGLVTADAHSRVRRYLAEELPGGLRERAQRATRAHAAARGIGCLHEAGGPDINGEADLASLQALCAGEPGPDLIAYWGSTDLAAVEALGSAGAGGDLFVDGAVGSGTALLRDPYADRPGTGNRYLEGAAVSAHLVAATTAGVQAGFHAIGDAALDLVVAGMRAAVAECGLAAVRAARHRVEHACLCMPEQAAVLAWAGCVASVQPQFDAAWGGPGGTYEQRLGRQRAAGMHDLAGLARAGVMLALGSDSPVTELAPWEAVRAAAWTHNPEHRLSVRAAFNAATRGGWRAARRDEVGVLAPGAPAYFAVWDSRELAVQVPDSRVRSWSTDPRSGTPGLPPLDPGTPAPQCLATVAAGRLIHAVPGRFDWTATMPDPGGG